MKNKLKVLLPLLFVIALIAVMSFAVNAEECENHNIIHVEAQSPTCHTEGNTEYWYCTECECFWADEELILRTNYKLTRIEPSEDVDLIFVPQKDPTCSEAGMKEHWSCPECGIIRLDPDGIEVTRPFVEIPAIEHTIVHVEAQEPSCHSDGNIEYWHCSECNRYWGDEELSIRIGNPNMSVVLKALGHDYVNGVCTRCGEGCFVFPDDKWYLKGVEYCYENGYMKGVSESSFGYKQTVNRATFVTVLAKIDGTDAPSYDKMSFSDVRPGVWYSNSIEWAYRNGYAAGLGDGIFGYKQNITREQLVTFLYTYSKKKGVDVSDRADISLFNDSSDIHDYARDAMSWAVYAGLVTGTGEATLSPRAFATRAELATIIMNYVEDVLK